MLTFWLAKTFVMRILFVPKPTKLSDLDVWVKPEAKRFDAHVARERRNHAQLTQSAGKRIRPFESFEVYT